ncbi:unnamed protein product [Darwinula stevensoni]|uniref:Uncharacterized protein n=1 Tax=Darwinula stevensoni TaxID=69355 RepID=A0A7R8XEC0_9CRUS|nr:unnamed protein product [Darwinula stevensoni]CAG0887675.1 unnamed protein product [Darwinula stevensoni]
MPIQRKLQFRATTEGVQVVSRRGQHHHAPEPGKLQARKVIANIVNDAKSTQQKTGQILQANLMGLNTEAQEALPDANLLARQVRHHREENVPNKSSDCDSDCVRKPSLQRHNASYCGTAKMPTGYSCFQRLRTCGSYLHAKIDERLYTRMLEHLHFQHGIAAPQSVTTDFEKAAQNALERVFPDNYIGRVMRGNRRIPPLFEPGLWNNYNRVLQDLPRTTNAVEGFHSSFLKDCDGLHLNFFTYRDRQFRRDTACGSG